ncbi:MAG: TlpA family protein disulfide reductase [Burkholderiales bacterium]|nr:TlpA family protein disulfide reductase [Burkholderiales bacterium]MDE2610720.1 TlpA family protein disulfide reductase [Burkholderiales bacterium]
MKKIRSIFLSFTAIAALAAGIYVAWRVHAPKQVGDPAVQLLFSTRLPDLAGQEQALNQWQQRTLVVNFWAPWCSPCVQEMPDLARIANEFKAKNVQFVGIGIDSAKNLQAFEAKVKVQYPLLVAGYAGTDLSRALGDTMGALPFTVVIDPMGKIRLTKLGQIRPGELRSALNAL